MLTHLRGHMPIRMTNGIVTGRRRPKCGSCENHNIDDESMQHPFSHEKCRPNNTTVEANLHCGGEFRWRGRARRLTVPI